MRYGDEVEFSFGSHHWPTWGNEQLLDFWKGQRDTYCYIHHEVLRLANHFSPQRVIQLLNAGTFT